MRIFQISFQGLYTREAVFGARKRCKRSAFVCGAVVYRKTIAWTARIREWANGAGYAVWWIGNTHLSGCCFGEYSFHRLLAGGRAAGRWPTGRWPKMLPLGTPWALVLPYLRLDEQSLHRSLQPLQL